MSEAHLSVTFAGPLVTLQDGGRRGHLRFGVPASGAMDRLAFDAANAALGNPHGHTAIEVSLGGLILQCKSGSVTLAVTGGAFVVEHGARKLRSWTVLTLQEGERLAVRAGEDGSWAYVAFAGQIEAANWLGSQATHASSGFGGGALRSGQGLAIKDVQAREDRLGDIDKPSFIGDGPIGVVIGPQDRHFAQEAVTLFLTTPFRVTDAYDRMGMRLKGAALELDGALSIPSEPIVRGAVQVSGDGVPTVLLADHQTTGGYPKIATVLSCEIDRLVQLRSGQDVKFAQVTAEQAVGQARAYARAREDYLAEIAVPRGTLEQRLMRENLISGWGDV
jgi:allophanate hydrolase